MDIDKIVKEAIEENKSDLDKILDEIKEVIFTSHSYDEEKEKSIQEQQFEDIKEIIEKYF